MFAPGLISLIVSMALTAVPDLERQALDAAKSAEQSVASRIAPAPATQRRVMTWVTAYATTESLTALKQVHAKVGPGNALTHLALQFWWPTADGTGLQYSTDGEVSDQTVKTFVTWAHAHNIKVLLCVYNATPDWDWARAKKAFATNRVQFTAALTAEVKRLGLDGVDIDFEGEDPDGTTGHFNADKAAYVAFATALHAQLANTGKQLTVDSFPHIWNAPNSTWWPALLPVVDGLTSMGHDEIGRNAAGWASYAKQMAAAGKFADKLMLSMPSDQPAWQGNNAGEQAAWFLTVQKVGVAIWDAQLSATAWQQPTVWRNLRKLRDGQ